MKKGQVNVVIYFRIFEILLLVMVIMIIATEVTNVKDSGLYQKKFISRDLALVMDSLTNARGNLMYSYNPPLATLSKFDINLKGGMVLVDDEAWPYATNKLYRLNEPLAFEKPHALRIKKIGNSISVEDVKSKEVPFNGYVLECPGTASDISSIIIDPGHGYDAASGKGDVGLKGTFKDAKGTVTPESWLALSIGVTLQQHLIQNAVFRKEYIFATRALEYEFITVPAVSSEPFLAEEAKTTQERVAFITQNPNALVLSLHVGKGELKTNVIKAFVNKDANIETLRLACALLNAIATKYALHITGTAIIPVDLGQLSPDDPKQVLLKDRVAVQLELGNIDFALNNPLENQRDLAGAIAEGLQVFKS